MLIVFVCCVATWGADADDCIRQGRSYMFEGTLSGLRLAYQTFDDCLNDGACADCSANRELRFLNALVRTAMLVVRDDNGPIDSVFELGREFGVEVLGDCWARYFEPLGLGTNIPLNEHGAYEIPDGAPDADAVRFIIDTSMIPEIEAAIADLDSISDTPGDPFRIFLEPNETRIFSDPITPGLQTAVEVDYAEVLILKALLTALKGQLQAQSAYDQYVDSNDMLAEKIYGGSFNINDDLLDPYPDFLKVLPTARFPDVNGAALLAQAREDFIASIDYYFAVIDYIKSETDPQEDDLLYLDPNDSYTLEEAIRHRLTTLRDSLVNQTAVVYPYETTKTYNVYKDALLVGELELMWDLPGLGGDGLSLLFTDPRITPSRWEVDDFGIGHGNGLWVDLENYDNGWRRAFLDATLAADGNSFSVGDFAYMDSDWNWVTLRNISGQITGTVVADATLDLNPIYDASSPVNPRDLLPEFDEWNGPLPGTMGHGLGDDATLGGITPDMSQYDWQLLLELQPGGVFYLDFLSPWQIIVDGDTSDWTYNQPVIADISDDTNHYSEDVSGVDIAELYMGYDWENVYGAITFYDNIGAIPHYYDLYMSYSPDDDWAFDAIRLYIEVSEAGSAYGYVYHMINEYGYPYWDHVGSFEAAVGLNAVEFMIPFESIPVYLPGRFISLDSGAWNSMSNTYDGEDNYTHLRIAGAGTISGTITYHYPINALVCVQAYTDPCDPEGSLVASTTISASGPDIPYVLEGIGIGWQGYIRVFTPSYGFNVFDLDAPATEASIPVFLMNTELDGVDLVLDNPAIMIVDDDAADDPGPGNPDIGDPLEDGSTMHPFDSIQEAINAVADGNMVVVLEGTYTGSGNRDLDLLGKTIGLYGLAGPEGCIIECEHQGRGFYFHSGETEDTLVDGFTIRNGLADKGGGIYFDSSSPTIRNCIITDNSPDAIHVQDSDPVIGGTLEVVSDDITGNGTLRLPRGSILSIADSQIDCNMTGLGTIEVPAGRELTIANNAIIDLGDPIDPKIMGVIDCKGRLRVKDNAQLLGADARLAMAGFEGNAFIGYNKITTFESTPYGNMVVKDTAVIVNNDFYANGDRYIDIDPLTYADTNSIAGNHIYVTITKATGSAENGIFELRGEDYFCSGPVCEPNILEVETVPTFDLSTWTIDRLELLADAELALANRFGFQADYDGAREVLYVRELILGPNSILDIGANRLYYESLDADSTANIISMPLLGLSLDKLEFDDEDEFANRVGENNVEHIEDSSYDRVHVERISIEADSNGVMVMRNLEDIDPESPSYGDVFYSRAKTLFAKSGEDGLIIHLEYLFESGDPNAELHIYVSDVPDLLDHSDPNRAEHYIEAGYLSPPPAGRLGSVDSNEFAVFEKAVNVGSLDLTGGTWIELELVEPQGSVDMGLLFGDPAQAGPQALTEEPTSGHAVTLIGELSAEETHCGICMDLTGDNQPDEEDFAIAFAACGVPSGVSAGGIGSTTCIERLFSSDGFIDLFDMASIDWLLADPGSRLNACSDPYHSTGTTVAATSTPAGLMGYDGGLSLSSLPATVGDLLITGKTGIGGQIMSNPIDRLYTFDRFGENLQYYDFAPDSDRCHFRSLANRHPSGELDLYQINSAEGIFKLDDESQEYVITPGWADCNEEPRYHNSATVYVGIQSVSPDLAGRPVLDAAFDDDGYAYVVPVEVVPDGEEPYWAAAKLRLSEDEQYQVETLYDNALSLTDEQYRDNPREIEVDDAGNVYVVNVHRLGSDILWKYAPNGAVLSNLPLYHSDSESFVLDPIAMHISGDAETLYLASGQDYPSDAGSAPIYGFATKDLTLARSITVGNMQQITDITEDPTTGTLWVVGFNSELTGSYSWDQEVTLEAVLAKISPGCSMTEAVGISGFAGCDDLVLPMSIVWTGEAGLGRVDIHPDGEIDLVDYALLAGQWGATDCNPLNNWCEGADLVPPLAGAGRVDVHDLLILAEKWLNTDFY